MLSFKKKLYIDNNNDVASFKEVNKKSKVSVLVIIIIIIIIIIILLLLL